MCVISLCTRGALDTWSRRRSTAALDGMSTTIRVIAVVAALPTYTGCAPDLDRCFSAESERHNAALVRELAEAGLDHRREADNFICVRSDQWLETDRVRALVDRYRNGAAAIVKSPEHRQRLLAALERDGNEFEFSLADGRELVVLFSGSETELAEHQALLQALE